MITRRHWQSLGAVALSAGLLVGSWTGAVAQEEATGDTSFSLWQYEEPGIGDWWKSIISAYEDEYGGAVTIRNLPISDYGPQLTVEIANDAAADLILIPAFQLPEVAATGALMPLDEWLDSSGVRDRVIAAGWDFTTIDGTTWAVPIQGRTLELLYNQCLFDEVGIETPPTTPEEFLEAARALKKVDGGNVTQFGASMVNVNETDPTYEMLLMWTIAHGGTHFADADGNWTLTDQSVVDALDYMKLLYDEELIPRGVPESDQRALFATGISGMEIDGQWQFPFIEEQNAENIDCFKSATHPWSGPGTGGASVVLAVNADPVDEASALAFVETVTRPEHQSTFGDFSPNIPFGVDALTDEQIASRPYLTPWIEGIANSVWQPPTGHEAQWSQIWPIVVEAVTATLADGVPAAEALAEAQAELEACCSL
jgi:multiple sugar transport system substrate-binding protein